MKQFTAILMVLCVTALAGCNTMRGFGQDVERAGEAIQRGANR